MRWILLSSLIAIAPVSAAQGSTQTPRPPAVPAAEPGQTIIVTGPRMRDFRDRLAACLARNCPVNEDVDATLALAEALFLNGDYNQARVAVQGSLGRNRREAAHYPEPVADLFRAYSRLSRHLGFDDQAARSTDEILRSLRAGLPREDHRHFTARLEIADMQMAMGNSARARRELRELRELARAAGREDVAAIAELRTIWFDYIVSRHGDARARLIEMSRATEPGRRFMATGAKVLLARIYRSEGNRAEADALLAEIGQGTSARRRLISSPPYVLQVAEMVPIGEVGANPSAAQMTRFGNASNRNLDNFEDKWIDVGFWVTPDGQVSELDVLRRSGEAAWAAPLLESIRGRLYSTADEPTYRLERYTYTSGYETVAGTRMQQHSPHARVEFLDLTANAPESSPTSRPPTN